MVAAVAAFAGAACSSSQGDKYPTYDAMCSDVAQQECNSGSPGVAARCVIVPADTCVAARKKVCLDFASAAIQEGRTYTPSAAPGCVSKAQSTYSKTLIAPSDLADYATTCGRVYAGNVDKGGVCKSDFDCTGSRICDKGHCGDKVTKQKGDGCANPGEVCATGTFCADQGGGIRICTPKAAVGAQCDPAGTPCLENLRCVNGTCADRLGPRATCNPQQADPNADCGSSAPYCDVAAGNICTPGLSFATSSPDCVAYGAT